MNKKRPVIQPVIFAVTAIARLAMLFARDALIISLGIRRYGRICAAMTVAVLAAAAWAAVSAALYFRARKRAMLAEYAARLDAIPDKKDMDETVRRSLYKELVDLGCRKWSGMDGIGRLIQQLDSMDEYQSEMDRLLDQTDYLKQRPAEIVQKVEDCMYINVGKLLNYMRIVQTKTPDVVRDKIAECEFKNAALLKKTDDFIVAVVAYVNGDIAVGEEEKARTSVDEYMYVVLQAIDLPETQLQ